MQKLKLFVLLLTLMVTVFGLSNPVLAQTFTFKGRLLYPDGAKDEDLPPFPVITVRLYDDDSKAFTPSSAPLLGEAQTNNEGKFTISFDAAKFAANEDDNGDVLKEDWEKGPDLYIDIGLDEWDVANVMSFERPAGEEVYGWRSKTLWNYSSFSEREDFVVGRDEPEGETEAEAENWRKMGKYARAILHSRRWIKVEYDWIKEQVDWTRSQAVRVILINESGVSDAPGNSINLRKDDWNTAWVNTHEYAHTVMYALYNDSYPPTSYSGDHTRSTESDRGFAITEGWAEFMSTLLAPDDRDKASIETNDWWKGEDGDGTNNSGQIVEGAVASVLWDLIDPISSEDNDYIDGDYSGPGDNDVFGFRIYIWENILTKQPQKFKDFWNEWISVYSDSGKWQERQSFRGICERNGIVYSRVKITGGLPEGNEIVEFNDRLDTKPRKLTIEPLTASEIAPKGLSEEDLEPITSVRLQSKKTETLNNDDDFLKAENWVNIGRGTKDEGLTITLDPRKLPLGRDKIHLRVRATSGPDSDNTTYDTFYPDYGTTSDKKTIEHLKTLKVLYTDIKTRPARLTILDNSHSTGEGVAKEVARSAVKDASFKAVVRFHNGAWATVDGIFALDHALDLINGIEPAILTGKHGKGDTDIKAGLERGYEVLMRQKERAVAQGYDPPGKFYWSINTDWRAKEGNNYNSALQKLSNEFKGGGDPIISPDAQIAAEIMEQAGGAFYLSTSPEEVTINHEMISREQAIDTFALNKKYTFPWGGNFNEEMSLDASVSKALFVAKGTEGTTYLTLRRPDGSTVRSYNPGVEFYETTLNKMYILTNPQAGIWKISGKGRGTVRLKVGIETGINLELLTKLKSSGIQEKLIKVHLNADPQTIANSTLKVELSKRQEDDTTVPVETKELYDDGAHEDDAAGDGVFANTFTLGEGFYPFKVIANGTTTQGESYTRTLQHTLINKDMAPTITNLQPEGRFATGDLSISAFISDDNDLQASMIELRLNEEKISFTYDENINLKELGEEGGQLEEGEEFWNPESEDYDIAKISYTPSELLSESEYIVELIIKNKAGQVALETSWTFIVDLPTIADTMMINEVHPKEKWVELKCLKGPLDISQYILWDMEAKDTPLAEKPVTLKTGEFAIIHWEKDGIDDTDERGDLNGNGYVDLYSEDPVPFDKDDQMVLLNGKGVIIDVIVWADYDGEMKPVQVEQGNKLVKYGEWKGEFKETDESPAAMLGVSNQSIGRKPRSEDTNTKEEWTIQTRPTPGEENVTSTDPPAKGTIIINELNPAVEKGDWAELYCLSGPIDIATLALGHMGGKIESLAPSPVTLNTGEYVVAHWQEGVDETDEVGDVNGNGVRDIYISTSPLAATDDQLVLRVGTIVHDAVIWSNMDGEMTRGKDETANELVELGEWSGKFSETDQSDAVEIGTSLQSLGRIPNATDSNTKNDWKTLLIPSPGKPNQEIIPPAKGSLIINEVYLEDDESKSWAEIYCVNGPADLRGLVLTDKDGEDTTIVDTPATLGTGEYAVIHWEEGEDETDEKGDINRNGYRDLYLEDYSPTGTDDQSVLTVGGISYDAVIWTNNDGKIAKHEVKDSNQISEAKEWKGIFSQSDESKAVSHLGWYYHSIGRFPNLQDTNAKEDWRVMTPTPGKENISEDLTPPTTTLTPSHWMYKNEEGIYVAPSSYTYTLSAVDLLSGVDYIMVNIDNLGFLVYTEPISFTTEGEHTIQYGAVDKAGNEEEIRSFKVIVDDTLPVLTLTVEPLLISIGKVTITVTSDEALRYEPTVTVLDSAGQTITTAFSGVEEKTYTYLATVTDTTAEGEASVSVVGTDLAGNMERVSEGFTVDTTPPPRVTDLEAVSGTAVGTVDLSWKAPTDVGSNLDSYIVRYSTQPIIDEAIWIQTSQEDFALATLGNIDISTSPGDALLSKGISILWQYRDLGYPNDAKRLANGNTLIADSSNNRIIEVDLDKNIVWQYGGSYGSGPNQLGYPFDAERLANGNTLITDYRNQRVIEVDSDKNIVWQYGTTGSYGSGPNQLGYPLDAERLANGNTLIADSSNNRIIEVDLDKNIVWQYGGTYGSGPNQLKYPADAERLANSNTLISDRNGYRVIEVDLDKNIVWQYGGTYGSGPNQLKYPYDAERLTNGNTLITDYYNHRVIEVSPDKNIVWQYGTTGSYGSGPGQLRYPLDAERLPNNNTLITDTSNRRIIEVGQVLLATLTSPAHDLGFTSSFNTISWSADTPSETTVKFQIRTAPIEEELSTATWFGPTSTSDYYTVSGTTINRVHNNDRWIQYKAILETTEGDVSPILHDITIAVTREINWDTSTEVTEGVPVPSEVGTKETMTVGDLIPGTLYYFALKSKDKAGNISGISNSPSAEAQSDVTPPVTTLTPSGPLYNDGVNDFAPLDYTYTLTATDDISGVDHIEINIDGRGFVTYTEPISFATEGEHTIQYKAVDKAGNWEEAKTFTVIVDATPPKITITSPKTGEYYHTATIDVTYTVEDPLINGYASGVKEEIVLLDGEEYKEKTIDLSKMFGEHTFTVKATDNVGNKSETQVKFTVVLAAKVTIKPEVLKVTPGILTAFVEFPEGYDVASIIDATCDGAPLDKMMLSDDKTKMIIKFRRDRIEEALSQLDPPQSIDIHFVVKGHFEHDADIFIFKGEDSIEKIIEDTTPPTVSVRSPKKNQTIQGIVSVMGTVKDDTNLKEYEVKYGQGYSPTSWTTVLTSTLSVTNDTLAAWDVTKLDGVYTLKVTASDNSGNGGEASIAVTVDNTVVLLGPVVTPKVPAKPVTPTVPTLPTIPTVVTPTTPTEEVTPTTPTTPTTPEEEPEEEGEIGLSGTITPIPKE